MAKKRVKTVVKESETSTITELANGVHWELKVPGVSRKMLFSSEAKAKKFLSEMTVETFKPVKKSTEAIKLIS